MRAVSAFVLVITGTAAVTIAVVLYARYAPVPRFLRPSTREADRLLDLSRGDLDPRWPEVRKTFATPGDRYRELSVRPERQQGDKP